MAKKRTTGLKKPAPDVERPRILLTVIGMGVGLYMTISGAWILVSYATPNDWALRSATITYIEPLSLDDLFSSSAFWDQKHTVVSGGTTYKIEARYNSRSNIKVGDTVTIWVESAGTRAHFSKNPYDPGWGTTKLAGGVIIIGVYIWAWVRRPSTGKSISRKYR